MFGSNLFKIQMQMWSNLTKSGTNQISLTYQSIPGLDGISGEGDGGEPGDVADQADGEGEGL